MEKMKHKRFLVFGLVMSMIVCYLTSCGKENDRDKNEAAKEPVVKIIEIELTSEEYAFGVDKNQPELLDEVNEFIEEIKENGTFDEICNRYFGDGNPVPVHSAKLDPSKDQLVVATNATFEPFEYTNGEMYFGIDMEIAAALAESLGKELVIQNMDFDAVCFSVGQQKCDIAMAGLTIKEDRKEYVTFSDPYYEAAQKLIVLDSNEKFDDCKDAVSVEEMLETFDGKTKVGVQNGTTGQFYCEGDEGWGFAGFGFTTVVYKNGLLAVKDMINGNIDYVIIDSDPAKSIVNIMNERYGRTEEKDYINKIIN